MIHAFYEPFPETVMVEGRYYHIRTDFRNVLRLIDIVEENQDEQECLAALLSMYDHDRRLRNARPRINTGFFF